MRYSGPKSGMRSEYNACVSRTWEGLGGEEAKEEEAGKEEEEEEKEKEKEEQTGVEWGERSLKQSAVGGGRDACVWRSVSTGACLEVNRVIV